MSLQIYDEGYLQALDDIAEKLDNAVLNGGGLDAGDGKFISNAHWDHEIRDMLIQIKEEFKR